MADKKQYDFSDFDEAPTKTDAYDFSDFDEPSTEAKNDAAFEGVSSIAKYNPIPYIGAAGLTVGKTLANLVGGDFEGGADKQGLSEAYKTNVQQLQDVQAGGTQGALMGGEDELKAIIAAPMAKATGDKRNLADLYRQYQQLGEKKYKEAEERNPESTALGEIGGAVATGIVAGPALGVEKGILQAAKSVGLKEASKQGFKAAGKELLKQGAAAGTEAALFGAVQGGLSSDKNVGDLEGLGKDVLSGGTLGFVAGGVGKPAMSVASEGLERGINAASEGLKAPFKSSKVLSEAYELGATNAPIEEVEGSLVKSAELRNKDAYGLFEKFKKVENQLGQQVDDAYKAADASGITVPVNDDLNEAALKLQAYAKNRPDLGYENDREYKKLLDKLFMLKSQNLTASQVSTLADEVSELAGKFSNPELSNIAKRFGAQADAAMKNTFPDIGKANERFFNFKKFGTETFAQKGAVDSTVMTGFKKVEDQKALSGIKWALENINSGDTSKVADALSYAKEGLEGLEARHPGTIKMLGLDKVDDLEKLFYDSAKRTEVIKILNEPLVWGAVPKPTLGEAAATAVRGESPLLKKAITKTAYGAGKVSNKLQALSKNIANMGDDQLAEVAQKMSSGSPEAQKTGQALLNALQNKGTVTKNAAIFTILNSKNLRQEVGDMLGYSEDEGNEQQ
jgi:hypothetical protein